MVRLETKAFQTQRNKARSFTFQYGQIRNLLKIRKNKAIIFIYIPVWLDQKPFWVFKKD